MFNTTVTTVKLNGPNCPIEIFIRTQTVDNRLFKLLMCYNIIMCLPNIKIKFGKKHQSVIIVIGTTMFIAMCLKKYFFLGG